MSEDKPGGEEMLTFTLSRDNFQTMMAAMEMTSKALDVPVSPSVLDKLSEPKRTAFEAIRTRFRERMLEVMVLLALQAPEPEGDDE